MKYLILIFLILSESAFARIENISFPTEIKAERQVYFGLEFFNSNSGLGFGFDASTLWNKDFGWTIAFKIEPIGAEKSNVSYQTAKNTFGDSERGTKEGLVDLSIGRTYGFNDNFFVAAMIGIESYTKLVEFYDPTGILGNSGTYYVEKEKSSQAVFTGKLYYSVPNSKLGFSAGYQSGKAGTFFGVGYSY